jgi:hypothetical protein
MTIPPITPDSSTSFHVSTNIKRQRLPSSCLRTTNRNAEILETPRALKLTMTLPKGSTAQVSIQHGVLCIQTTHRIEMKGQVRMHTQKSRYAVTNVVDTSRMQALLDQRANLLTVTAPKLSSNTCMEIPVEMVHSKDLPDSNGDELRMYSQRGFSPINY